VGVYSEHSVGLLIYVAASWPTISDWLRYTRYQSIACPHGSLS